MSIRVQFTDDEYRVVKWSLMNTRTFIGVPIQDNNIPNEQQKLWLGEKAAELLFTLEEKELDKKFRAAGGKTKYIESLDSKKDPNAPLVK